MIITASTTNCALTVCQVGNIPNNSTCGVGARLTATQPASCRAEIPLPTNTTANTAIKAELAEKKVAIGNWRLVRIKNQAITASKATADSMPAKNHRPKPSVQMAA